MPLPPIQLCTRDSPEYPALLREMKGAPEQMYIRGDISLAQEPCISIVGSRRMSDYAQKIVRLFLPRLIRAGLTIVSGLAYGVDSYVHQVTLEEKGKAVVVLGSGLDSPYPRRNTSLYKELLFQGGCAISEYEAKVGPQTYHFPARNRIVAGLSQVTLIIEAGERSGTLITADQALRAGREVCVIPADITREQSKGIIYLLHQGAQAIGGVEDILQLYGRELELVPVERLQPALTGSPATLYDLISHGHSQIDELAAKSGLATAQVRSVLSVLELDGYIYCKGMQWLKI